MACEITECFVGMCNFSPFCRRNGFVKDILKRHYEKSENINRSQSSFRCFSHFTCESRANTKVPEKNSDRRPACILVGAGGLLFIAIRIEVLRKTRVAE